ncbi:MAG: serine/threonine protein kinase [Clostridia bacterium]|nr:serine/threonine protein kinase [Deltaproteobacteria bacterium]
MTSVVGPPSYEPEANRSGARFGKYRLIREIAIGGMAKIYLAAIDGPGGFSKMCVIKRILPEHHNFQEFSRMFVTEARVAALLNHPHIVQVFDFGQVSSEYYIAMEWVDGASLETLMQKAFAQGVIPGVHFALRVATPLCEALNYAHAAHLPDGPDLHLVHRDLTPGNVLLANNGVVKLTDFGVVKVSLDEDKTSVGVVKGKFAYMSPEQVRGDPIDKRSDIYALGIILYELSTGQWLFRRAQLTEVITAVSLGNIPPPSAIVSDVPPEFERIVMKALATAPDARYDNARDMLNDLERFQAQAQWTGGSREVVALMQAVLPPPDPRRYEPVPGAAMPPDVRDSDHEEDSIRVEADELIEVDSVDADGHSRSDWILWASVAFGGAATVALWFWLLK